MKRSEILERVCEAIEHRGGNVGCRWYLCWKDGKIQCVPMGNTPIPEIRFGIYTTWQLSYGLSSQYWDVLEAKIYTFLKEKGICQIQ